MEQQQIQPSASRGRMKEYKLVVVGAEGVGLPREGGEARDGKQE